jgi:tetratricopeptide (TPR) repeat protein
VAAAAAALAAAVLLLGGALRSDSAAQPAPRSADSLLAEGLDALRRAQESGDPAHYAPAERALTRARTLEQRNARVLLALSSLAAARHRFRDSLALAERARTLEPHDAEVYGLIGDASLELGRYDRAFASFDRQVELKPTASGYARISYARELLGDLDGAIVAMERAVAAAAGHPLGAAWAHVQLGNLRAQAGSDELAEREYRRALARRPGDARALAALGELEAKRGRFSEAIRLLRSATSETADPGPSVALARVLDAAGRSGDAEQAYAQAEELERRFAAYGGRNHLETAELDLNRDRRVRDALARARVGYRERPSVEGAHVLAWALYKNGRCAEARRYSIRSFRLGANDVDGLYHRGLIERCLGDERAAARFRARVLELEPRYQRTAPSAWRLRG